MQCYPATPIGPSTIQGAQRVPGVQDRGNVVSTMPYFSRVRFAISRAGADPYTYTLSAGTNVRAFNYGVNTDMGSAGISSYNATPADTNLTTAGKTLAGQAVNIFGVAILVNPVTDFEFLRLAAHRISVQIGLNGDDATLKLGTLLNLPSIGGLQGWGNTSIKPPPLASADNFAYLGTNGVPVAQNFRQIPEGIWWMPEGSKDSQFNIKFNCEEAVVTSSIAARTAAAGIQAFTPPATIYLDFTVHLMTASQSPQSANV